MSRISEDNEDKQGYIGEGEASDVRDIGRYE